MTPEAYQFKISIGDQSVTYDLRQTDAPEAYDGFGTFTVYSYGFTDGKAEDKDSFRYVLIREEHVNWQVARYSSGNHASPYPEHYFDRDAVIDILWKRLQGRKEE